MVEEPKCFRKMKINKIIGVVIITLIIFVNNNLLNGAPDVYDYTGERIL